MGQSKMFWWAFGLLCGAGVLSVLNPCVGVFAIFYLILALVALVGYLVMRSRARTLREDGEPTARRDAIWLSTRATSHLLFGLAAVFTVVMTVTLSVLVMLGLDPETGGKVMFPVQLAPFDAALDLWAAASVMAIAAAVLLVNAGRDVRRWIGSIR